MKRDMHYATRKGGRQELSSVTRAVLVSGLVVSLGILSGLCAFGADVDTTTGLSFSPASVVVGQDVTVTWTVTAASGPVTFGDDLTRRVKSPGSGTWDILDGTVLTSGDTPFTSSYLFTPNKAGSYLAEGSYPGCPTCSPTLGSSSGSALLTVSKAGTSVAIASDKAAPVTGETITFTATVAASLPGTGTPTGTVTFYAGGTPIAGGQNVVLDGSGEAQCTASFTASDSPVSITAAYGGDANYNGSDNTASPLSQTINEAATTTVVTSTPEPSVTGQDVTFTATVTANIPGTGTPTGTVTFTIEDKDDNPIATSGAIALDGLGQATHTTNEFKASLSAPAGTPPDGYRVTATYDGTTDVNYNDSPVSAIHYQVVDKADTSISITSDNPDPSLEGQAYTVTWSAIAVAPGSEVPAISAGLSGNVTVDDGAVFAPATPVATGTVSITSTTAGAKTLTATYAGDTDYNGSDTTESHTVGSKGTSISVSSSPNPSYVTGQVVFTATLTPDSPGGPDPTGTVTFRDTTNTKVLGTDSVDADGWSVTYSFDPAAGDPTGSRDITAEYGGDSVYTGSTSSAISHTVNKLDLVLTITGDSPDPSVLDAPYTVTWFSASVDPDGGAIPPNAPTPTGIVTVTDGTDSTTPVDISVGTAPLTSTTGGVKTLTASYVGDSYYNAATDTETHIVDKGAVTINVTWPTYPGAWPHGDPGTDPFTATVTPVAPTAGPPTGTVSFHIEDAGGITIANTGPHTLDGSGVAASDDVTLLAGQSVVKVYVTYSGDARFNPASPSPTPVTVAPSGWAITSDTPDPSYVGQIITVSWVYPGTFPDGGTVTVSDGVDTSVGVTVTTTDTTGSSTLALLTAGARTLVATFDPSGAGANEDTAGEPHTVSTYATATALSLNPGAVFVNQPTTLDANVIVTGTWTPPSIPGLPGKPVDFAVTAPPGATGDLSGPYCILVGGADDASCSIVTYTPTAASSNSEQHWIRAMFPGDSDYGASESVYPNPPGTYVSDFTPLTVNKRPPTVTVVCVPDWVYIDQETICTVTVSDSTGMPGSTIPEGTLSFSNGGKLGIFSPAASGSLTHGTYDTTYTPAAGDAGTSTATTTIGVDYGGSSVYTTGTSSAALEVRVRPTETTLTWEDSQGGNDALFLRETGRVIVTVTDIGPADSASPPQGTLNVTAPSPAVVTLVSSLTPISGSTNASQAVYDFSQPTSTESHTFVPVTATYVPAPSPQTHGGSDGSTDVSVQKRTTETVLDCTDSSPYPCTATVTDTATRGDPVSPGGTVVDQADSSTFCTLPGACTKNYDTDTPMMEPVAVGYVPGDDIHLGSYGMDIIKRPLPVSPGDCGGVHHIEDSILGLNITCTIMAALQVLLESGATTASILVDPVWTAIFPGSTIPVGDMIAGGLTGLSLHGEIAIQTMCTDVDGDGIPGSVEAVIGGLWDHFWDSDSDGMGDLDEIDEANGDMSVSYDVSQHATCCCPNPTVADSDGDDIQDGNEHGYFGTSFCNDDTDEDGLDDGQEVGTFAQYNSDSGATIVRRTDARDHADPLAADTDGDGLGDAQEFTPGRLATSTSDPDYSSFINDADSDDDNIQDGAEDLNHNGLWDDGLAGGPAVIGGSTTSGSGESHLCMWDTDGDGLSDGEEVALFGAGAVHVITPTGSTTVPPLDTDSDDDGLSDYEEVNITKTDPLDFDTDNDGLWDVDELKATGGAWPARNFAQVSDPLDPDTDDDDILDNNEYNGTGLGVGHGLGGDDDTVCPYVNDDDSDNDGLQDGVEDANHDGTWGINGSGITIGTFSTQASKSVAYWETDPCDPDTDGDGIRDGEEVNLIGGGPIPGRPIPLPGFYTVTPEGRSTVAPVGPDYGGGPLFTFTPTNGPAIGVTVPALDVDSDNDGLSDYEEVNITGTDPLDADSDNDTLMDADELVAVGGTTGSTPRRTFDQESDPLDINTDDDHLFDPVEGECGDVVNYGTGLSALAGLTGGDRDTTCPYINDDDSDDDGVQDGAVIPISRQGPGLLYSYIFIEGFEDVATADILPPGTVRTIVTPATGEQSTDTICNACDPDSDSDGLTDGEEVGIGTDPQDWDTDDDGRNDWHEQTGGGPIPTDPFDPDTDDDGLLDSAEVFGSNPTNPTNADTDGDGLCDGGAGTPYMTSGHATVIVNPICKSCAEPGLDPCAVSVRPGSADGIGDHPNPHGYGEDKNGNGAWDSGPSYWAGDETDPNQYDTDGDADGDGIEVLGFSTSRQGWIPTADLFGRAITVTYPECGCLNPLDPDTDDDQLEDGYEDRNHDGNFDFLPSEFDHQDPLPGPPIPYPTETNPCDHDTDDDELDDYEERYQAQVSAFYANWDNDGDGLYNEDPFVDGIDEDGDGLDGEDPVEPPFNPTNPLDHDTDNDRILDGPEVFWECVALAYWTLDNDTDGLTDEDPIDGIDNDEDGLIDEDPQDYWIRFVPMLDPTNRDSDSDGFIDGLDDDPCNSELIPLLAAVQAEPIDTDGDGFSDEDELLAGTHPNDPEDHPAAFGMMNLDLDDCFDDRMWLEPVLCCGIANSVVIDIDSNVLADIRVQIVQPRDVRVGDFDGDGYEDDARYVIEYAFAMYRVVQRRIVATIDDYDMDLVIDAASLDQK